MGLIDWIKRIIAPVSSRRDSRSPFAVGTGPSRLVLLRHAEKTGDKRDPHLSRAGTNRAERLVSYIPQTFGPPQFLIAARTSARSRRPVETLEPLAAALTLEIMAKLDDEDVAKLVRVLGDDPRYRARSGVISWRHSDLPDLTTALGAPSDTLPAGWHDDDYTSIVEVTYPGDGTVVAKRLTMPF